MSRPKKRRPKLPVDGSQEAAPPPREGGAGDGRPHPPGVGEDPGGPRSLLGVFHAMDPVFCNEQVSPSPQPPPPSPSLPLVPAAPLAAQPRPRRPLPVLGPGPGTARAPKKASRLLSKRTYPAKRHDVERVSPPADGVEEVLVAPGGGAVHLQLVARLPAGGEEAVFSHHRAPRPQDTAPTPTSES